MVVDESFTAAIAALDAMQPAPIGQIIYYHDPGLPIWECPCWECIDLEEAARIATTPEEGT